VNQELESRRRRAAMSKRAAFPRSASLGALLLIGCAGLPSLADSLPADSPDTALVREALHTLAEMEADGHLDLLEQGDCPFQASAHADCLVARSRLAEVVEIRDRLEAHANPAAVAVLHAGVANVKRAPTGCEAPADSMVAARRAVLLHEYSLSERVDFELEIEGDEPGPCYDVPTVGGELRAVAPRDHRDELHPRYVRLGAARPIAADRYGWVADTLQGRPELEGARVVLVEISGVCGPLCGQGYDNAVALVDGRWLYLGSAVTWVSSRPELRI
jgi:hypothetical protein